MATQYKQDIAITQRKLRDAGFKEPEMNYAGNLLFGATDRGKRWAYITLGRDGTWIAQFEASDRTWVTTVIRPSKAVITFEVATCDEWSRRMLSEGLIG